MATLSESEAGLLVEHMSYRFPRLLFALYDRFPSAGAEVRLEVCAVRCTPAHGRMDGRMGRDLQVLVGSRVPEAVPDEVGEIRLKLSAEGVVEDGEGAAVVLVRHCDVAEFARRILKGEPRYVDMLASEEVPLLDSDELTSLREAVSRSCCDGIRAGKSYRMACVGPAKGLLKAQGDSSQVLSDSMVRVLGGLCVRAAADSDAGEVAKFVDGGEASRDAWQTLVERLMKSVAKGTTFNMPNKLLEGWVDKIYEADFRSFVAECVGMPFEKCSVPMEIAADLQFNAVPEIAAMGAEPVRHLARAWPDGAVMAFIAQTGSYMYDLQVARSDKDYSIVFLSQPDVLASRSLPSKSFTHKAKACFGDDKRDEVEFDGKELATFVLEVAKGNPIVVELLFTEKPHQTSDVFQNLRARRRSFLTCRCAKQYLGFIGDRLGRAGTALDVAGQFDEVKAAKASKWLYHAHHKIFELQRILDGEEPKVALDGEEREFVLALRTKPPATADDAKTLVAQGEQRRRELLAKFDEVVAAGALPAEVDAAALLAWLAEVRKAQISSRYLAEAGALFNFNLRSSE